MPRPDNIPRYAYHRLLAEEALAVLDTRAADSGDDGLAAEAQAHATLALVDLLRELRDDFRDVRHDVAKLTR